MRGGPTAVAVTSRVTLSVHVAGGRPRGYPMTRRWLWLVCSFVVAIYALLWLPAPEVDALVSEDGIVGSAGALGLLLTSLAFAAMAWWEHRQRSARRYSFAVLALIFFFGAGEEISWGQRIFGIPQPPALAEVNVQHELNIHNLVFMSGWWTSAGSSTSSLWRSP